MENKETKSTKIRCYSCGIVYFNWKDFRYECMCFNKSDVPYRGICLKCEKIPTKEWKEIPDKNHHLKKLHTYTKEYNEWYDSTWGKHPKSHGGSMTDDKLIIDGENGEKFEYLIFKGKFCTCCNIMI